MGERHPLKTADEVIKYISDNILQFEAGECTSVNDKGIFGDSMLHWVVEFEPEDDIAYVHARLLIDAGADVNAEGEMSARPLHAAARKGRRDVCELLLKNGAERAPKDEWGQTASESAWHAGFDSLANLLRPVS